MTKAQKNLLIFLIGCVAALGPFTIDMYLPAFPALAKDFNTSEKNIALTLSTYFIGISIGQLIYGPLIDRYGRKRPLLIGLTIYLFASIGCALADSLQSMIVLRFIQALGASVGMVAGKAIIRDLFEVKEVARVLSSILLVMGVAPIVAPSLGSFLITTFGWQSIFIFLSTICVLLITMLYFFLKGGRGPDKTVSLKFLTILKNYIKTLENRAFTYYSVAGSLALATIFAYISSIPFILMNLYKVSETTFGWLFGLNAFGFVLGSQVNRFLLKRINLVRLTNYVSYVNFLVSLLFLLLGYFLALPLVLFCTFLFCILFFSGFVNPNATALSLEGFRKNVGYASALNGSIRMAAGAIVSALIGVCYDGTMNPMLFFIFGLTLLTLVFLKLAKAK